MRKRSDFFGSPAIPPAVQLACVGAVYPLTRGRMISTGAAARPGRTCAGTPHPAQNRRYATALRAALDTPPHRLRPALYRVRGWPGNRATGASRPNEEATVTDQANTQQAADDRQYVDPADLTCPGCGEQVRCEPPGYWRVAWGLPAAGFSHEDATALCPARSTDRPAEPVEIDRA